MDAPIVYDAIPNNPSSVWRFSGKINSRFGDWNVQLSALWNDRISKNSKGTGPMRQYKNASQFIRRN